MANLTWRDVWRDGICPLLEEEDLESLRAALLDSDARLIQGASMVPAACDENRSRPVQAACVLAWPLWSEGVTVGELEDEFADLAFAVDLRLNLPGATRYFMSWWDLTEYSEARALLLTEVRRELLWRERYLTVAQGG